MANLIGYPDDPSIKPDHLPCDSETFKVNMDLNWADANAYDVFVKMLPADFYPKIKTETNRYARQLIDAARAKGPFPPHGILANWSPVTLSELKKFFAIVIHIGLVHKPSFRDYWSTDPTVSSNFAPMLLPRNRWLAISSMLHFSDSANYIPRGEDGHDPLYKIRPILEPILENFSSAATPGRQLSLDEARGIQGRCIVSSL